MYNDHTYAVIPLYVLVVRKNPKLFLSTPDKRDKDKKGM
jgi:hypothetical protein